MHGGLRFSDLIKLSFRVVKTKPMRTLLTVTGMSIGISAVVFLTSLGFGLQSILIGNLITTQDSLITIETLKQPESGSNMTSQDIQQIHGLPGVGEISPVAEFPAEMQYGSFSGQIIARLVRPNYFRLAGVQPEQGLVFMENDPGAVLSDQTVRLLGFAKNELGLGKSISLKALYQQESSLEVENVDFLKPLVVRGVVNAEGEPPFAIVPVGYARKEPPFFSKVLVKAKDLDTVEPLRDSLLKQGYFISAKIDLVNQARKFLSIITIVLSTFGITALVVSAIGMFNTMIIGFLERIYEVGVIKSLGGSDKDIKRLFLIESLMMGLSGGLGGILIGVGLGKVANLGMNILARRLGGNPVTLFVTPIWFIGFILAVSALIGLLSGYWPARRAAQLSPKEAFLRK